MANICELTEDDLAAVAGGDNNDLNHEGNINIDPGGDPGISDPFANPFVYP